MNNSIATKEALFAKEMIENFASGRAQRSGTINLDTLNQLSKGEYKLADSSVYVKADVTGKSSDHRILDQNSAYKEGTINVDKGRLPKGENLFFSRVQVGYGKAANETDPALVAFTSVVSAANLDLALAGADLIINQGSRVLVDLPIKQFLSEAPSHYPRGSRNVGLELNAPQYLTEGDGIQISLRFPDGQQVEVDGTNRHHIEVVIPGLKTVPR